MRAKKKRKTKKAGSVFFISNPQFPCLGKITTTRTAGKFKKERKKKGKKEKE